MHPSDFFSPDTDTWALSIGPHRALIWYQCLINKLCASLGGTDSDLSFICRANKSVLNSYLLKDWYDEDFSCSLSDEQLTLNVIRGSLVAKWADLTWTLLSGVKLGILDLMVLFHLEPECPDWTVPDVKIIESFGSVKRRKSLLYSYSWSEIFKIHQWKKWGNVKCPDELFALIISSTDWTGVFVLSHLFTFEPFLYSFCVYLCLLKLLLLICLFLINLYFGKGVQWTYSLILHFKSASVGKFRLMLRSIVTSVVSWPK